MLLCLLPAFKMSIAQTVSVFFRAKKCLRCIQNERTKNHIHRNILLTLTFITITFQLNSNPFY